MSGSKVNQGIQGLRGVAILLVLLNHAHVPGFEGGYIGVDVFFVISGYLIGGLLHREGQQTGRIDLWQFYARRIRRLFPAFLLLIVAVALAILLLRSPPEWAENFSAVRASVLYASNIWFTSRAVDYFAGSVEAHPLLHLWSLAVEEQFYFIWPLITVACLHRANGRAKTRLGWVVAATLLISLMACVWVTRLNQPLAFFNTPFRMWEFAAGIALVWVRSATVRQPGRLAWIGWVGLAAFTVFIDENRSFPGAWALIPVVCACCLIVAATVGGETWPQRLLKAPALVWLGNCSYSLYLWHWPLLIFGAQLWPQGGWRVGGALIAACLAAGWASWRYVEEPFRHMHAAANRPAGLVGAGFLLVLMMAGVFTLPKFLKIDSGQQAILDQVKEKSSARVQGCHAEFATIDLPDCNFGDESGPVVVLWGDSHALNWFPAWEVLANRQGWRLISLTKSACPVWDVPVWNTKLRREYIECGRWRDQTAARIIALQPRLVIISNSYMLATDLDQWRTGMRTQLSRINSAHIPVAVFRDTPRLGFDAPTCVARAHWRAQHPRESCLFPARDERVWRNDVADIEAAETSGRPLVLHVDPSAAFCTPGSRCPTFDVVDGQVKLRFYDADHFTPRFMRSISGVVEARVMAEAKAKRIERVLELFK